MRTLLKNKWFLLGYGAGAAIFLWLFFGLYKTAPALAVVFVLTVGLASVFALNILTRE